MSKDSLSKFSGNRDTSSITTTVSAGVAFGGLAGFLATFPQLDYFFGIGLLERYIATVLCITHNAYLPLNCSALLVLAYALGGAILGIGVWALIKFMPVKRIGIVRSRLSITTAMSFIGSLALIFLWIRRGILVGLLQVAVILGVSWIWVNCVAFLLELLFRTMFNWLRITSIFVVAFLIFFFLWTVLSRPRSEKINEIRPMTASYPLLLIGLDAASWVNMEKQLENRELPSIHGLRERGCWGELESIPGKFSPALWTTVVTGVSPEDHGIRGFSVNQVPYTSNSRTAWSLWEILPKFAQSSAFHYWWASWPAEQVDGLIISNRFMCHELSERVYPAEMTETLDAYIAKILPEAPEAIQFLGPKQAFGKQHELKMSLFQEMLTQDFIVAKLGERALLDGKFDLISVYFRSIDTVGHKFWRWHYHRTSPTLAKWIYGQPQQSNQELLGAVIEKTYKWSDNIIGGLLEKAGTSTNILICSDHGMTCVKPELDKLESESGHHHPIGMILLAGPDIRQGRVLRGASLYDVFPTVLYLLGLPICEGLKGRPLIEAIDAQVLKERPVRYIESYGERASLNTRPIQTEGDDELLQRLRSLGYVTH
ncbi:MAG: alkaline phosphatase family protein [Candidatus Hodarchaeota archaeon]